MKDTRFPAAGHRHKHDRIQKWCPAFFFSAWFIGKWWSKCCLALDRNSQHGKMPFSCTVSPLILTLKGVRELFQFVSIIDKSCLCVLDVLSVRPTPQVHHLRLLWPHQGWVPVPSSTIPQVPTKHTAYIQTPQFILQANNVDFCKNALVRSALSTSTALTKLCLNITDQWKCAVVKSRCKDINRKTLTVHKTVLVIKRSLPLKAQSVKFCSS